MKNCTLVIMAAGRGSRFGGLKQIEDIDGRGHRLIDYSVYDAVLVGFDKIVFIIDPRTELEFREIGHTYSRKYDISVDFAFQTVDKMPDGLTPPLQRKKPWGTAHAVACLEGMIDLPFALINADDFYGRSSLSKIFEFISCGISSDHDCAMVGYRLNNTLSENGGVSRGICEINGGFLAGITERKGIRKEKGKITSNDGNEQITLDPDSLVSVNLWGFTPGIIEECKSGFADFLNHRSAEDINDSEFYLPDVVSSSIHRGIYNVTVLESDDRWCGMTYREDLISLKYALEDMISRDIPKGRLFR